MTTSYKRTLIIAPHSDDEIFTFPFIFSPENSFDVIDLLLLERDYERYKEAMLSAKINKFNLITLPKYLNPRGLYFHKIIRELTIYFETLWHNYDLVLSPIIEGGHQDHDTVCAALIRSKIDNNTKLILYSTYRSIDEFPWLYTCGLSSKISSKYILSVNMPRNWLYLLLKTVILSYKSQFKTWLLLSPAILFSLIRGNLNKFVLGNSLDYNDLRQLIPANPLYQTYRNCSREYWIKHFDSINKENN